MRAVLGAGRARIVRQSLIESLVLALGGGGLGFLLAVFSLKLVVSVGGDKVPRLRDAQIDLTMLGITILLSLLTGLLFGLAPALYTSRITVGGRQWTRRTLPARNFLVVSEIALATMLLVGAGLLIKSFFRLQHGSAPPRIELHQRISHGFHGSISVKSVESVAGLERNRERSLCGREKKC